MSSLSPSSSTTPSGQSYTETTFKDRLDEAAEDARHPNNAKEMHQLNLDEKISEYIAAAARILGVTGRADPELTPPRRVSGPPKRPLHDEHIEEFVRDQHRSKGQDGSVAS
ncbi:hypothetical protein F4776DRAFT_664779 [Hypoxylon sp. NC0597]|nr:hypothetical protein F4776DRAFT_664779 [Hypoxylon sp. NC0597]